MNLPISEQLALRPTPMGALDARVKFSMTVLYTLAVVSVPFDRPALLFPLALPLALAVGAADVPLGYLARRLLAGLPFVAFVLLFPLLLQRDPALLEAGPLRVPVTRGVLHSLVVGGKFVLAFGAAVVLTASTGFPRICDAMARLRLPSLFVQSVAMIWRYLFVLADEGSRMIRARRARCGRRMHAAQAWSSSAAIVGGLFLRALSRSERVQAAMESRGFTGLLPAPAPVVMRARDWAVLTLVTSYLSIWIVVPWLI